MIMDVAWQVSGTTLRARRQFLTSRALLLLGAEPKGKMATGHTIMQQQ